MHSNGMMGAANFLRGAKFDPVAQLVEQRTFKTRGPMRAPLFCAQQRRVITALAGIVTMGPLQLWDSRSLSASPGFFLNTALCAVVARERRVAFTDPKV